MTRNKEQMIALVMHLKQLPKSVMMTMALDALMSFYLDKGRHQDRSDDGHMDAAHAFVAVRKAIDAADLLDQFGEALDDVMSNLRAISDEPEQEGE